MKRLLIGSLIVPILGTSAVGHARGNLFDLFNSFRDTPQEEAVNKKKKKKKVIPPSDFEDQFGQDDFGQDPFEQDRFGRSRFDWEQEQEDQFNPFIQEDQFGVNLQPGFQVGVDDGRPSNVNDYGEEAPIPMPYPSWRMKTKSLATSAALYSALGMSAIWTVDGRLTTLALQLREMLLNADQDGLVISDYWTQDHENIFHTLSAENSAQFESMMTASFIKFVSHVSIGRVNPAAAGDEIKVSARSLKAETLAALLLNTSSDLKSSVEALKPQWKAYRDLRMALNMLRLQDESIVFPEIKKPSKNPSIGDSGAVFGAIKRRLGTLGYSMPETSDVFTPELQKTVRQYMADTNLSGDADLNLGSSFWTSISTPLSARMSQIMLTMEKLRWVKNTPEANHIEVNLAFQRLRVFEGNNVVLAMKTINGRPERKTPMLQDKVVNVELNPTWTVPASLIIKDKLPAIQANPNYVEEHHFTVWNPDFTQKYDSTRIDWSRVSAKDVGKFYLEQDSGLGNALGVMKFNLTNEYAIYLHDTNERHLFPANYRQLSSGCVRLEKPFKLAAYLLKDDPKWSSEEALLAGTSTTEWADDSVPKVQKENYIKIAKEKQIAVYLMYLSAEVDPETGVLKFGSDFYGQDQRLYNALKSAAGR